VRASTPSRAFGCSFSWELRVRAGSICGSTLTALAEALRSLAIMLPSSSMNGLSAIVSEGEIEVLLRDTEGGANLDCYQARWRELSL